MPGLLKYVSCNDLGCYGVNHFNQIYYSYVVVNAENCAGSASLVPRPNRYRCVPLCGYFVENTIGNAWSGLAENAEKSV